MRLHARTLVDLLPKTLPQATASVSTLLFEPSSRSLALMLSDSSYLLYASFSPFSSPTPPTTVPRDSTAACFLRLLPSPAADGHVLFLSASPQPAGPAVHLRAWILLPRGLFAPARLNFKSDRARSALALPLPHGLSVRLAASTNVFVLHSLAANQIWVFAARLPGDHDDDGGGGHPAVDLMKCAVVDLVLPVHSVAVSMGFLILGEENGVRVFPLRPLIKGEGRVARRSGLGQKRLSAAKGIDSVANACKKGVLNGVVIPPSCAKSGTGSIAAGKPLRPEAGGCCNDRGAEVESVVEKGAPGDRAPYKLRTVRVSQNSSDHSSFFVVMTCGDIQNSKNAMRVLTSVKAVSIHALSQKKFLILDSAGDLHVLSLHGTVKAPKDTHYSVTSKDAHVNCLDHTMKVQMLAVIPDISTKIQVVWISDGGYSVHMMSVADMECPVSENDDNESKQKGIQISAIEAIFTSEKVQDIVPLSANAILVLGQGSIFAYATA